MRVVVYLGNVCQDQRHRFNDFAFHSFPELNITAFQAFLVVRPALAEVLMLTELGRRRTGTNTSLMAPLVSAVLKNIAQQVGYAYYL